MSEIALMIAEMTAHFVFEDFTGVEGAAEMGIYTEEDFADMIMEDPDQLEGALLYLSEFDEEDLIEYLSGTGCNARAADYILNTIKKAGAAA